MERRPDSVTAPESVPSQPVTGKPGCPPLSEPVRALLSSQTRFNPRPFRLLFLPQQEAQPELLETP